MIGVGQMKRENQIVPSKDLFAFPEPRHFLAAPFALQERRRQNRNDERRGVERFVDPVLAVGAFGNGRGVLEYPDFRLPPDQLLQIVPQQAPRMAQIAARGGVIGTRVAPETDRFEGGGRGLVDGPRLV